MQLVNQDELKDKNSQITRDEVIKKIMTEVRRSSLIRMSHGQEERIFKGNKYIVQYDKVNNLYKVVTMLITEVTQKELFTEKFTDDIDESLFRTQKTR